MKYLIKDGSKVMFSKMRNGTLYSHDNFMHGMHDIIVQNNILVNGLDSKICPIIIFYESLDQETHSSIVFSVFADNIEKLP
jgi:hypothetical protein